MKRFAALGLVLALLAGLIYLFFQETPQVPLAPHEITSRPAPKFSKGPKRLRAVQAQAPVQVPSDAAVPKILHRVCVENTQEEPLQALALSFYCSDSSALRAHGRSDASGCVEISPCPGSEIATCARLLDSRYRQGEAWVLDAQAKETTFVAQGAPILSGKLRNDRGEPVAGARLWLVPDDPDPLAAPSWLARSQVSDEHGEFQWQGIQPAPCDPCVVDPEDCELSRRQGAQEGPQAGRFWIRHPEHRLHEVILPTDWGNLQAIELQAPLAPIVVGLEGLMVGQQATVMLSHPQRPRDRQSLKAKVGQELVFRGLGEGMYELSVHVDNQLRLRRRGLAAGQKLHLDLRDPGN